MTELAGPIARTSLGVFEATDTRSGRDILVPRPHHFASGSYVITNIVPTAFASPWAHGDLQSAVSNVRVLYPAGTAKRLVEKTFVPSGAANAATLSVRSFALAAAAKVLFAAEPWFASGEAAVVAVTSVRDNRLLPLFARLAAFEAGEWESYRGRRPSRRALDKAAAVLRTLYGSSVLPERLIGADARIVFYFTTGEKYSNIEVTNTGSVFLIKGDEQSRPAAQLVTDRSLRSVIDEVRAFLS